MGSQVPVTNSQNSIGVSGKKRPESNYSRRNAQSSCALTNEKSMIKRVGRLRIAFDLELNENIYGKFIKKPKLAKEKKFQSQN